MLVIFALFQFCSNQDLLWEHRLSELRQFTKEKEWLQAKAVLDVLRDQDEGRFENDQLNLCQAYIAEKEKKWDSAFGYYRTSLKPKSALHLLAEAEALIAIGKPDQALIRLEEIKPSGLPDAEHRERRRFLLAEQYLKIKEYVKSEKGFRWLTQNARSQEFVLSSYANLIELNVMKRNDTKVRNYSEILQSRWSGSDEALESAKYQWQNENPFYLGRSAMRIGMVGYRNRDYELADECFSRVVQLHQEGNWQKALYLKSLTFLKKERPQEAFEAFSQNLLQLKGSPYEGLAVFQTARALFLLGRDTEVLQWVQDHAQEDLPSKWRWESEKLKILAMRRAGRTPEFDRLWTTYEQEGAPAWLLSFYHQQGMVQAILQGKPQRALRHFQAMPRRFLDMHEKLELEFWNAVIKQKQGDQNAAEAIWGELCERYPNHFFGIASRHMLGGQPGSKKLNPSPTGRKEPAAALDFDIDYTALNLQSKARSFARIGRFDWAAWALSKEKSQMPNLQYLLLMSKWFEASELHFEAITLSPAIMSLFPQNTPIEQLPEFLQRQIYPLGFSQQVEREAEVSNVDPLLLQAIMREETHFNPDAKSSASARGLMQFIPETARRVSSKRFPGLEFQTVQLYNPEYAISLGAAFLSHLQESFGYMSLYSIAAYNAGEGAVEKWKSLSLTEIGTGEALVFDPLLFIFDVTYDETKRYCQKVLTSYYQYRRIYLGEQMYPQGFSTIIGKD